MSKGELDMNTNMDTIEIIDRAVSSLEESTSKNVTVSTALVMGDAIVDNINQSVNEYKVVNDFFNSELVGTEDKNLKKIVAAATIFAKQKGVLPSPLQSCGAEEIASIVDEGLTQAKVAYKTAKGFIESAEDAIDALVDRGAARLCTMIDNAIPTLQNLSETIVEKSLPKIINTVTTAVSVAFPATRPVMNVVKSFSPFITKAVKPIVREGVAIVANVAKSAVRCLASGFKSLSSKVASFLKA